MQITYVVGISKEPNPTDHNSLRMLPSEGLCVNGGEFKSLALSRILYISISGGFVWMRRVSSYRDVSEFVGMNLESSISANLRFCH